MKNILVMRKLINGSVLRVALLLMFLPLSLAGWASATYKYQLKTVTQNNTGLGRVYASTSSTAPDDYSVYYANNNSAYDAATASSGTYYLFAIPNQRGVVFNNWTTSSTSSSNCTAGSSTLTNATTMQGASVKITAPTNANGTSTYTTTATVTANWNQHTKAVITYAKPTDGKYRVTYDYSYLNTSTNALETGFYFDMDESSTARSEDSYNNDVITLQSLDGVFEGWYNGSTLLSTDNPYTYVAPASGGSVTISAHYTHVDKYYGKLTASIAAVPYSMPGGGTIFIANDPDATGTYSDAAQQVSLTTYGVSQSYYLHAQPTDKRYVFRGWYSDATCTSLISTDADYAYTFTSSSTNSASPTLGNVYAAFDFNLYYMQVEVEPAVPGLGMVLVKDNNTGTPEYTDYTTHAEQFLYAYRLAPTANAYLYAKPKYGYKFSGWYDNPDCTGTAKSTANPYTYAATGTSTDPMNPTIIKLYAKFVEDASTVNITYNRPDQTKGEYTASVLDIAEVDDDFIWTFTQVFTSEGKTGNTTQAQHKTDVLRLEAQPKAGYGVTSWTIAGATKTTPSQLYETTGTAAATYGVTFGDAKPFLVSRNSTYYADFQEAITAANGSGKITVVQNAYIPAGNYTIPSGVSLVVPYESEGKTYTSPSSTYEKNQAYSSASQYVLLTLASGANITIAGSLYVMADLCSANGGAQGNGAPASAYGRIVMSENSTITINNGANLYCWGFITGTQGLVTIKNGGKVHEPFQHQNNPGGSKALAWNEKAFFMNQYYVQNVESPLKFEYGAVNQVYALLYIQGYQHANAPLIGKDNTGMFALTSSGSYLIRTYNPATDRTTYDIYGNAKLNYISMNVYLDIDTRNYVLPITSNMSIKCHILDGVASALNIQYAVSFIPGAELIVDEGVTLNVANKLIIYDRDEWIGNGFAEFSLLSGGGNWTRSSFTPTRSYTRVNADLVDAKVDLNGTMNVTGSLYTTSSGAAIISSKGTGVVQLSAAAPSNSNDIQYKSNNLGTSTNVPITPAQLHNGDDSYTATAGSVSGDQYIYSKPQERWLKNPKVVSWNANGGTIEASTMAYSQGSPLGALPAAYKDGYTLEGWYTAASGGTAIGPTTKVTANATYHAHWTPKTYTITYRDIDGEAFSGTHVDSPNAHPTTHTFGTATTLNSATKDGFIFGGWYRTPSCSGTAVTTLSASECKDITLYAQWRAVSVTANGKTNYYTSLSKALAVANTKTESTITILVDITDTTTPLSYAPASANSTCTLDLNGKTVTLTVTGAGTSEIKMFNINAASSTFTITDNTTNKDGKLILKQGINTATATKRWRGVFLTDGTLILNAGEIQAINDFTYTSTSNTGIISTVCVAAGKTFTMNGGSIYAESPYYPRAIEIAGSATAKATVTLNAGTITANATKVTNAMGIYTVGGTTTIKNGVTINATTTTTSAYGIYVDASTSNYWGTVNMTGGTVNATATTTTALGAFVNGTYTFNNTTPNTVKGTYRGVLNISGGTFNVETLGTTTAYGIQTRGTTTISGGTFNVTPKTTTAYGLLVEDGTTTVSGTPTFTVEGTKTAYGIYASAKTPDDKTGRPYNPNVIVNGGTFDVTTTTSEIAYGIYAGAGTRIITNTASGYYPGIYSSIGTVTVNGGTFNVTAKTYNAIGVYVHRVAAYEAGTNTAHVFRGVANIAGGTFTVRDLTHKTTTGACDGVRSYGTLNITGGSFDVAASAATVKNATSVYGVNVYDGTATISGNPEFTVSAYGTAYGAVANGAAPDSKTGLPCAGNLTIDGGTFNVSTTTSTTAYGVYTAGPAPRVITSTDDGYYPGTYYSKPVATVNDGTFNVEAKTTTAIGAYCGRGVRYDPDVLEPHTVDLESFSELNITGGTFNVSTLGTTTADGVRSHGTTNISGGTFNVTPKSTTAMGVRAYAGKTTITGNPHFTVKGTTTVYGLNAGCEAPNAKSGLTYNGEIECNGGTFDLETTTGATCYGVYAYAGSVKITTLNSADANYFAGNYASAGTIVVNDGIFNVKAKTTGAYGVYVLAAVSQSGATGYPTATAAAKCDINGGKFLVSGTEKYAVYKKATTANFKISGGYWGGDNVNNNLVYYAVSPKSVWTLPKTHDEYTNGYRYKVTDAYTLIWSTDGDALTGTYTSGAVEAGYDITAPNTPTKTGYTFAAWTPEYTGTMPSESTTYTATWTVNSHNLAWQTDGDALTGSYTKGIVEYGTTITAPNTPTKDNYVFNGWNTAGGAAAETMPDEDLTYIAQWVPAVASVAVSGNTTYYATVADAITFANDKTDAVVTILQDASVASEITISAAMTIDLNGKTISSTNTTDIGVFKISASGKTVTIRDSGTNGKISRIASSTVYMSVINLDAGSLNIEGGTIYAENTNTTSNSAYRACGIYNKNSNTISLSMSGGTIEAKRQSTYAYGIYLYNTNCTLTLTGGTITASGTGSVRGIFQRGGKATLSNATITATTTGSGNCYTLLSDNSAKFTINSGTYTATATGSATDVYVICASNASVSAIVNGGRFSGKSKELAKTAGTFTLQGGYYVHSTDLEDNCANNYHALQLTSGTEYEAGYLYKVAEAYTVTFNANGHGMVPAGQIVEKGEKATIPSEPTADGWEFGGWYKEAECTTAWNFATDAVTEATTLYAKWTAKEEGPELDIIEWNGSSSVVINMNGYTTDCKSYKDNWEISVNGIIKTYYNIDLDDKRRLTIDLSELNLSEGDVVTIKLVNGCGQTESLHTYQVPYQYSTDGEADLSSSVNEESKVRINKGSVRVTIPVNLHTLVVNPGAKLIIPAGVKLTVWGELIVRTTQTLAGEIVNNGTIEFKSTAKMYYTRITTDNNYQQFALPFVSDLTKVTTSRYADVYRTRKPAVLGATFSLSKYDGERRATNNTSSGNWTDLNRAYTTLEAGTGYLMLSSSKYYCEYYFPVTYSKVEDGAKVAVSKYEGTEKTAEHNKSWNFIASPYTHTFDYTFSDPADAVKLCYQQTDGRYIQDVFEQITPARPFFYQPANDGYLTFSSSTLANIAARDNDRKVQTQWLRLLYGYENEQIDSYDPTSVYLHPTRFTTGYERQYESMKLTTSGAKPAIFSTLEYGNLAFAAVADSVAEKQMIPLTVYQPNAGEMRFTLTDNDFLSRLASVLLYDTHTGRVIDLMVRDYVYEAQAGTITDRFYLQPRFLSNMPQVTTDIADEQDLISVYANEHIINVAGVAEGETVYCFDATGRLAGRQVSAGLPMQFSVPADGMYIIKTNDKQVKVVVK